MTIAEVISKVDELKPNTYTTEDKVEWLSNLDSRVKSQIIDAHEGTDKEKAIEEYIQANITNHEKAVVEYMKVNEVSREEAEKNVEFHEIKYKEAKEHIEATRNDIFFNSYDHKIDQDTVLLVPAPYDEMYLRWLEAQIDYYNGEDERHNNAIMRFNNAYEGYKKHYTRTHMPISHGARFVF